MLAEALENNKRRTPWPKVVSLVVAIGLLSLLFVGTNNSKDKSMEGSLPDVGGMVGDLDEFGHSTEADQVVGRLPHKESAPTTTSCLDKLAEIARDKPESVVAFPLADDFDDGKFLVTDEGQAKAETIVSKLGTRHKVMNLGNRFALLYADNTVITGDPSECKIVSVHEPEADGSINKGVSSIVTDNLRVAQDKTPTPPPTRKPTPVKPNGCKNVRRDWYDISQAERNLYIDGYKELYRAGKLRAFQQEHQEAGSAGVDGFMYHGNQRFLPWHRYFIFELERQIRALGGKYKCFNLPYWDWTRTAGQAVSSNPMFTQGLGGNGDSAKGWCVQGGKFGQGSYSLTNGQCLRRQFSTRNVYPTIQSTLNLIEQMFELANFSPRLESFHGQAHVSIGGRAGTMSSIQLATDDPMFFLLHGFVDFQYSMWTDCHDYEKVKSTDRVPAAVYPGDANAQLTYPVLAKQSWALASTETYTIRTMMKTQTWGYTYHGSNMIARSGMTMNRCTWNRIAFSQKVEMPTQVQADVTKMMNMRIRVSSKLSDQNKARMACYMSRYYARKNGLADTKCPHTGPIEKCRGRGVLNISLKALLNKRGVKNNMCKKAIRMQMYAWCKQLRLLRQLCNGYFDGGQCSSHLPQN